MKKRLICLIVSLVMVMQMLGGWSAFAADTDEIGTPETGAAEDVFDSEEYPSEDEEYPPQDEEYSPEDEEESPQDEDVTTPSVDALDDIALYASDRVAAESNFATDIFALETADGTWQVDQYTPGGNPSGSPCLWGAYSTTANVSNGGWKLIPVADGYYRITNSNGALAATDEESVVFNQAASTTDKAQQWQLLPDDSTEDPYDCKIVNAFYNTQLTYGDTVQNGTYLYLAVEGKNWAVRDMNQTEKLGSPAFVVPGPSPEDGDRTAASNNFDTDYFTLETADGVYQVEHYKGTGTPSLWGAYSTSADNGGNGGWKLTPVKDGYYRITTNTGSALAAADASTVVYNQTVDAENAAQQWKLAPDESTSTLYDCKIVNAEYGTELAYAKPVANDADLSLAGSGDSWVVRNLKQTELLGFVALVMPGDSEYVDWGDLVEISVGEKGEVARDEAYEGPQITKVRVINEGNFLEIYWDRYVDEVQAINVDNFALKNGDAKIVLQAKASDYTNTLYFDKNNKEIGATAANCMSRLDDDLHMSSIYYEGRIDMSKGLTLEVKGAAIKDESGKAAKSASYQNVPKVDYYTQFLTSKTGIIIKADGTVAPSTLLAAAAQVDVELAKTETGIAANMAAHGCSLAVYSPHQNAYFIPEHRTGFRNDMYDVEGYGGSFYNNCVSSIAERNILRTRGNTEDRAQNTGYPDENILIHEFGHCIKSVGIESLADQTLANEMFDCYVNAKESGLWPNTYRISNSDEFFATMCAVWFNVMDESSGWTDGVRCPLNTREELKKYDPMTYAFFEKILPSDVELPAPWNEHAPDIYHDEYIDPAPLANQVEAVDSNFETDVFMLVAPYRGETKLIEKYAPDGSRPDENLCLWWVYGTAPDREENWAYQVVVTDEGYYRFVATDSGVAVTATSESTVAAEGHASDPADPAQQWKFVEDANTTTLYDGKLVSVKYGTELAFEKPFVDGSIVCLAPAGSGDRWFVKNMTQSAAVGKDAYLKPGVAETPTVPDVPVVPTPNPGNSGSSGGTTQKPSTTTEPTPDVTTEPTEPVTTTTTLPDGGTMTVETQVDGTTVTTVEQPDGTVSTMTETPAGTASASVALSEEAVSAAGTEPVVLPLPEVPVSNNSFTAATVTITAPTTEPVTVEIPVQSSTPGTVAILVNADGTEEIIKTSIASDGTLSVEIPAGGATVKIMDNSKTFADTAVFWGSDAVAFVTARELFNGTSTTTFSPDDSMTRGMLMTVLARFDGEDTTGGSTWYEKGVAWAVSQGISDGTLPDAGISRQELVVMLYRYAGQPAASGSLAAFPDAADTAQWAEQAMAWAVENGLITGMETGALEPLGPATRGQVATILMRFVTLMAQ